MALGSPSLCSFCAFQSIHKNDSCSVQFQIHVLVMHKSTNFLTQGIPTTDYEILVLNDGVDISPQES